MYKNILWDFDGVILDSMPIRTYGFKMIFENYNYTDVEKLLNYHNLNGGLSRFNKIKYFYNEILKQNITDEKINEYAEEFTKIMKKSLINEKYLIIDSINFISENYRKYNFHIVSGSEEKELNYICNKLDISKYFKSINGSPTHKNILVHDLLNKEKYNKDDTILIGDSINDYEAAVCNEIKFYGYNNHELEIYGNYINSFSIDFK